MPRLITRRSALAAVAVPAMLATSRVAKAEVARPKAGVNIAGAEFGRVPGRYGTEYTYPGTRHIDYFAGLGMTLVRLHFAGSGYSRRCLVLLMRRSSSVSQHL